MWKVTPQADSIRRQYSHAPPARAVTSVLYASVLTISSHSVDEGLTQTVTGIALAGTAGVSACANSANRFEFSTINRSASATKSIKAALSSAEIVPSLFWSKRLSSSACFSGGRCCGSGGSGMRRTYKCVVIETAAG